MPTILLGNTAILQPSGTSGVVHNGDGPPAPEGAVPRPDLGSSVTTIKPPADAPLDAQLEGVVGAFAAHSSAAPSWVDGDSPDLIAAVAAHYGCPVGRPVDKD